MKIYVITKGEYSNYYICGVAVDREKAETLARIYSDKWEKADVEEYDTDNYNPVLEGKTAYRVLFLKNGDVDRVMTPEYDFFEPIVENIHYWTGATLSVGVYADDEKSAIKIASEKRAKFLAEKYKL